MGENTFQKNFKKSAAATPVEVLIAQAASRGVLALTSRCNLHCLFCSNRQNPPGVEAVAIAPRTPFQVKEVLSFVDPQGPVVIGESATRIVEGEPFTHPQLLEILALVRRKLPRAPIRLTTNGSLLTPRAAKALAQLGGVEVCLSLNSASALGRALLCGDENPAAALAAPQLLAEHGVPFHGSAVALPHVTGWSGLEETVHCLAQSGALTVRLFLPGYTRCSPPALVFGPGLWEELAGFARRLSAQTGVPVFCEPPLVEDLTPRLAGVIRGTPAAAAGLLAGDVVLSVDGEPPRSRVHAFSLLQRAGSPLLEVQRGGRTFCVRLAKRAGERPGAVMERDLDPAAVEALVKEVIRRRAKSATVVSSRLGAPLLEAGIKAWGNAGGGGLWCGGENGAGGASLEVLAAENRTFGGSIACAGLLTVSDVEALLEARWAVKRPPCDLILLPGSAFDARGRDLTGRSYRELEAKFGVPAALAGG